MRVGKQDGQTRSLWPLTTNLAQVEHVAGPGLTLEFNFQLAIIVWGLVLGISWLVLAVTYDTELMHLGLHTATNTRQNCIVVAFGSEAQRRLMFAKSCFLAGAYAFSFAYFVALGVWHKRMFQCMDLHMLSHKDEHCAAWPLVA